MLIALTRGQLAIVDDEDFQRVSGYQWSADFNKCVESFYAVTNVGRKKVYMHRLILDVKKGERTDHENHNTLDNRRKNISTCTPHENMHNIKLAKVNTSGFCGVSWSKSKGKWVARIKVHDRVFHLGYFIDKGEAVIARQVANLKYGFHENHGMKLQEE